ncbi:hypothetical protein [Bradyrhizobium roseum]|uniref:hypothetical protein n=1 Tax=Bradyrhizobium roseum TaxID=3056648 RepID=UPI00262C2659|nr:hypothetical protein [Bradyrhizobium roseus]WKA30596.1 hypothetical protein QUH67_10700 [Bradyrhizobium roseus]
MNEKDGQSAATLARRRRYPGTRPCAFRRRCLRGRGWCRGRTVETGHRMLGALRLGQAAICVLILLAFVVAPAHSQENKPVDVAPGGVVILKRELAGSVTNETAARGGIVTKTSSGAPPQTTLIYMPPAGARELDDIVTYTLNGVAQPQITVNVRPLAPTLDSGKLYDASFKALFVLFVLAVLVESGLALLFRWRPFLDYFDSRSMNALVAFLFSLLLVRLFNLDISSQLISVYTDSSYTFDSWKGWPGSLLTAMIIAGGSAGVNRIFQNFGFRPTSSQEQPKKPELVKTEAWIAVTLLRDKSKGSVVVLINDQAVGAISGSSPRYRFLQYFVRNKGRFPQTGGYSVLAGAEHEITVEDANNKQLSAKWGPYKVGSRAIIDVELTL